MTMNSKSSEQPSGAEPPNANRPAHFRRSSATRLFLTGLLSVAGLYGVVLAYHVTHPRNAAADDPHWLEQCRRICADFGLVSSGNLKQDAEAYLEVLDSRKLSTSLQQLLNDSAFAKAPTSEHRFLGQTAPDFQLSNHLGDVVSLSDLNQDGPVVLVFYYGYNCSHCVAQLIALDKDLAMFRELGAEIVAVSADTPEHTQQKFKQYGDFGFPVLSDSDYAVATQWDVYTPATADTSDDLLHATFVIDGTGTVVFAQRGYQPFLDNRSLLHWIADMQPRPATLSASQN